MKTLVTWNSCCFLYLVLIVHTGGGMSGREYGREILKHCRGSISLFDIGTWYNDACKAEQPLEVGVRLSLATSSVFRDQGEKWATLQLSKAVSKLTVSYGNALR